MFLLMVLTTAGGASTLSFDLPVDSPADIALQDSPEGIIPFIAGSYLSGLAGMPMLPEQARSLPLPSGYHAIGINASAEWETLALDVYIPPIPVPVPLIFEDISTPDVQLSEAYFSDTWWPECPVRLTGTCFSEGLPHASVLVSPLRWDPSSRTLQRLTSLEVDIVTEPSPLRPLPLVDDDIQKMLIVTDGSLQGIFEQLAERRIDQGISTEVITMSEIYSTAAGRDDAEKLRNFIKDYHSSYGLDYLLLGGDTELVPFRYAFAMTCEAGIHSREDSLPCDLYFSDLDGTWDANGNDIFGEVDDDVDLYPDILVGRATVEDPVEAQIFVDNIEAYEDCETSDHYQSALFLAEVLWTNPYTDASLSKDYIDEEFVPWWITITKLYESLGNENIGTVMIAMNEGQNSINHDGHAWWSSIGVGEGYMTAENMDALDSGGRFASFMYSIGCWSAAFDFDAVAEHFITNPDGGGVAYVGNSSYGWGSPGNPCYGYSDALDHLFFELLFSDPSLTNGELLAQTKVHFIPYSMWENVYRWHQYDVNLLGDPSLRPYRTTPDTPQVSCPAIVSPETQRFPVRVSGVSTEGLTVCIRDDGDIWMVEELDATGLVDFQLPVQVQGSMKVTVTGVGISRTTIVVGQASGPDPVISGLVIDDSAGFGFLTPGSHAGLDITILNQGTDDLSSVLITIDSLSGAGQLVQATSSFGSIPAGDEVLGNPSLSLDVDESAQTGDVLILRGELASGEGSYDFTLPLMVRAPGLYFATYSVNDTLSGNGNGIPDPGESFELIINIANLGLLGALEVTVEMTGYPGWVHFDPATSWADTVPVDGTESFSFNCQLDASAPSPSFPWLYMAISSETTGYAVSDSLRLTVGETGISNDVESGASGWTHSGTLDMWNITDSQSHSPTHSWHCGGSEGYVQGMDCSLLSPELILAPEASISFWAAFDVAIYGSDGLYVLIHDLTESSIDTLDFIGSGGALSVGLKGIGTGWVDWNYDLSDYDAGSTVQLEFRFVSNDDQDTGAGFYIDDITIAGAYTGGTGVSGSTPVPPPMLGLPRPNPASGAVALPVCLQDDGEWDLGIYDLTGRLVMSVTGASPVQELLQIDLSELAAGIYMLRMTGGASTASTRLVLLP